MRIATLFLTALVVFGAGPWPLGPECRSGACVGGAEAPDCCVDALSTSAAPPELRSSSPAPSCDECRELEIITAVVPDRSSTAIDLPAPRAHRMHAVHGSGDGLAAEPRPIAASPRPPDQLRERRGIVLLI